MDKSGLHTITSAQAQPVRLEIDSTIWWEDLQVI